MHVHATLHYTYIENYYVSKLQLYSISLRSQSLACEWTKFLTEGVMSRQIRLYRLFWVWHRVLIHLHCGLCISFFQWLFIHFICLGIYNWDVSTQVSLWPTWSLTILTTDLVLIKMFSLVLSDCCPVKPCWKVSRTTLYTALVNHYLLFLRKQIFATAASVWIPNSYHLLRSMPWFCSRNRWT